MSTIEVRGGLLQKLVVLVACLSATRAVATPSTIPYSVDAEIWFAPGPSTTVSPGLMLSEADVHNTLAEVQAARRLIASGAFHGYKGFEEYVQNVERALDAYDLSQQRGSGMLQLAASFAMARRSFQESADTVATWTKIAGYIDPSARFVRVPERLVKRGQLEVTQEPALSPDDITAWLDLDMAAL